MQITHNIENECFKTHSFGSLVFKDYKYSVIYIPYIAYFFSSFVLFSTSNVRMSEGTFCRIAVHNLTFWHTT